MKKSATLRRRPWFELETEWALDRVLAGLGDAERDHAFGLDRDRLAILACRCADLVLIVSYTTKRKAMLSKVEKAYREIKRTYDAAHAAGIATIENLGDAAVEAAALEANETFNEAVRSYRRERVVAIVAARKKGVTCRALAKRFGMTCGHVREIYVDATRTADEARCRKRRMSGQR